MKLKRIFNFILLIFMLFTLSSCFSNDIIGPNTSGEYFSSKTYSVTFIYNNNSPNTVIDVKKGSTVSAVEDPIKTNYNFVGWYTNYNFSEKYDFSKSVNNNLTLYAKYEIDAKTITNKISTDLIKGIVKIYNKCYNKTFFGNEKDVITGQGSGFCFYENQGVYYTITNCHVAVKNPSSSYQEYTIEDYQGNTYKGYLYENPNSKLFGIDATYDLACLYFFAGSTNVKELNIASKNLSVNEDVISLGAPNGQSNTITYGKIQKYGQVKLECESYQSNVTFDVAIHNAYINHGSSGGPLLDANLNVIGVNYGGSEAGNIGSAIPAEKLIEFLNKYLRS